MRLLGSVISILVLSTLAGCQSTKFVQPDVQTGSMVFEGIAEPTTAEQKHSQNASKKAWVDGRSYDIDYHELSKTNDKIGDEIFGLMKDRAGNALTRDGKPYICRGKSGPDHTSILQYENQLFAVTHFECSNGGAYVAKLNQNKETGKLSVDSLTSVDFSSVRGTYVGCAGVTTAWGTHLGSEEYEVPMALMKDDGSFPKSYKKGKRQGKRIAAIAAYNQLENTGENAKHFGYYHGWTPEIKIINADGDTEVTKHYAMGRFSHELAYVMPDNKTVYLADDGTRVGLFMFIADVPGDLSAGVLYAAKWVQESNVGAGSASLEWINLGHATNEEIDAKLNDLSYSFDSMWFKEQAARDGSCPTNFKSVNSGEEGLLCLKLKDGQEKFASRLETRLYAAYNGATTEFNKEEGITYNPDMRQLYIAMSRIEAGMEDFQRGGEKSNKYDLGGPNHIRLAHNLCGAVYASDVVTGVRDSQGYPIASHYVASNMKGVVMGEEVDYEGTAFEGNVCNVNKIAMPDNLSYLPKYGVLLIGEDTQKNDVDKIWAYDVRANNLTRVFSVPYGSETTSPFWHRNINGFGYATAVIQHPYGELKKNGGVEKPPEGSEKLESVIGYIGPFPALD